MNLMTQPVDELDYLPEPQASVLRLVEGNKLSYEQAAWAMGTFEVPIPIGTIRSRLSRARAARRVRLANSGMAHV